MRDEAALNPCILNVRSSYIEPSFSEHQVENLAAECGSVFHFTLSLFLTKGECLNVLYGNFAKC